MTTHRASRVGNATGGQDDCRPVRSRRLCRQRLVADVIGIHSLGRQTSGLSRFLQPLRLVTGIAGRTCDESTRPSAVQPLPFAGLLLVSATNSRIARRPYSGTQRSGLLQTLGWLPALRTPLAWRGRRSHRVSSHGRLGSAHNQMSQRQPIPGPPQRVQQQRPGGEDYSGFRAKPWGLA